MNWDQVQGKWKQYQGKMKQRWGKLTDDDLDQISGRRDELVGKLQEYYGIQKEAAEQQADDFMKRLGQGEPIAEPKGSPDEANAKRAGRG